MQEQDDGTVDAASRYLVFNDIPAFYWNSGNTRLFYQIPFDKHMEYSSALLYFNVKKYVIENALLFPKSLNLKPDNVLGH